MLSFSPISHFVILIFLSGYPLGFTMFLPSEDDMPFDRTLLEVNPLGRYLAVTSTPGLFAVPEGHTNFLGVGSVLPIYNHVRITSPHLLSPKLSSVRRISSIFPPLLRSLSSLLQLQGFSLFLSVPDALTLLFFPRLIFFSACSRQHGDCKPSRWHWIL